MSEVYIDTSGLLPLLDQSDQDHRDVVDALAELARQRATLVTSSYVLVEAGALVRRRLGTEAFRRLGETAARAMDVIWVDRELHAHAWAQATLEGRNGPSLVDWVGFLLMEEHGIEVALALDRHFELRGFRRVPG